MNVHIIRAAEYPGNSYDFILKELNEIQGPINFKGHEPIDANFPNRKRHENLVFFEHCKRFRDGCNISVDDFVVFLATRDNKDQWFSRFEKKNIFIYCSEWDHMGKDSIYPVTYEILANVIQSLMKLKLDRSNKLLHEPPIGCMNDFCADKSNIMLKLRTGDICQNCIAAITKKKVDPRAVEQALEAFDVIRTKLLFRQGFRRKLSSIVFDGQSIRFPGFSTEIEDMTALRRTLYKYILVNQPIQRSAFQSAELYELYLTYEPTGDNDKHRKTITNLIYPISSTFNSNITRINEDIERAVGKQLLHHYEIKKCNDGYGCSMAPDQIIIL